MSDTLQRFLFENAAIRGEVLQLDSSWQAVIENHDYPQPVKQLLGQMLSAVVLLSATLKFSGKLSLQLQGSGPISLMIAECTTGQESEVRHLRGIAHSADVVPVGGLKELAGDGHLVMNLEPSGESGKEKERYQSIVELLGDSLSDALENYLVRSEQLDTQLWLACDEQRCGGLLIQRLPANDEVTDQDAWERVQQLSATIQEPELLNLDADEIIHRLYHEEDIRLFEKEPLKFYCPCSRDRVASMLRSLGYEEVRSIIEEQSNVEVACEFCNHKYLFDAVDIEELFASDMPSPPSGSEH
ncbi:MAG: Hsp33 family molecular chaperone HslO [Thioalkalispiraceae bacterium]|jgi:molecular chaperone Hsp33